MHPCMHGERLLETARAVLFDELLPALPSHKRHAALMVANAMAIAARAMNRPGAHRPDDDTAATTDRERCQAIRQGLVDAGDHAAKLHACLLAEARARVELSNPRYLATRPGTAP
jgi:hypothetical protein